MKNLMRGTLIFGAAFVLMLAPRSLLAASNCSSGGGLTNPIGFCSLGEFLTAILGLVIALATPIIILFIIYIGFRFVQESAAGNAEKMKELRGLLMWAIIGALIVLSAQALSAAIQATVTDLSS